MKVQPAARSLNPIKAFKVQAALVSVKKYWAEFL
jgi:hypothetical protein